MNLLQRWYEQETSEKWILEIWKLELAAVCLMKKDQACQTRGINNSMICYNNTHLPTTSSLPTTSRYNMPTWHCRLITSVAVYQYDSDISHLYQKRRLMDCDLVLYNNVQVQPFIQTHIFCVSAVCITYEKDSGSSGLTYVSFCVRTDNRSWQCSIWRLFLFSNVPSNL